MSSLKIESIPDRTKHVVLGLKSNDHKAKLLSILYVFRDWLKNPDSRKLTVQFECGSKNNFLLTSGLCENIRKLNFYQSTKSILFDGTYWVDLQTIFGKWVHFSGSYSYPVPCNLSENTKDMAAYVYESYRSNRSLNMYCIYDVYGNLRVQLLDFIIRCIEENFKAFVRVDKWKEV